MKTKLKPGVKSMKIAMIGHKRIPTRSGGVEVVVEELSTRMAEKGHDVVVYNRRCKEEKMKTLMRLFILFLLLLNAFSKNMMLSITTPRALVP